MKKITLLTILSFLSLNIIAQNQLDVAGNANISGTFTTGGLGTLTSGIRTLVPPQIDGQGGYFSWNRRGLGRSMLASQKGTGNGGFEFITYNQDNTIRNVSMTITGTGEVGIGTDSPTAKLDIIGNISIIKAVGDSSLFIGANAGKSNTTGYLNTFIGINAGKSNTTGYLNTFLGRGAGFNNTTGYENTFVGEIAGYYNTTGSFNTFLGEQAGFRTTGSRNTFVGRDAGKRNTTGHDNTFVGEVAGGTNSTGNENTFVGENSGFGAINSNTLTALGYQASPIPCCNLSANEPINNAFVIGGYSLITSSNSGVLGNLSMQKIGGYVNWGTASDGRMKKAVKEDVKGLDFILQLRPVSYQVDALRMDQFLRKGMESVSRAKDQTDEEKAEEAKRKKTYEGYLKEKSKIRYTGFVAQEVEQAAEQSDFEFSGVVKPSHDQDHYTLRYAEFVVPLVKGMQEQQEVIEDLEVKVKEIDQLKKENKSQQQRIDKLEALVQQLLSNKKEDNEKGFSYILPLENKAMLSQNRPNPFDQNTVIDYFIPASYKDAKIQVTSADGKELGVVDILEAGQGQVTIRTKAYPAGTYYYSLLLDGELFETKRMVLTR